MSLLKRPQNSGHVFYVRPTVARNIATAMQEIQQSNLFFPPIFLPREIHPGQRPGDVLNALRVFLDSYVAEQKLRDDGHPTVQHGHPLRRDGYRQLPSEPPHGAPILLIDDVSVVRHREKFHRNFE